MDAFLLNMEKDVRRLERFTQRCPPGLSVCRLVGVPGSELSRDLLAREGMILPDLHYSNPALGNAHSHVSLWRLAIVGNRTVTILEDDAVLSFDFVVKANELLDKVDGDWDILLWGWNFDAFLWVEMPERVGIAKIQCDETLLRHNIEHFMTQRVERVTLRLRHAFGIMSYSVSPKGARRLIDICLPLSNELVAFPDCGVVVENKTIDARMNLAFPQINGFVCFPPLAVSENKHERSNIWGVGP
ncbi:MAG: hypothetical protein JWL62_2491 [Hyphomicrobiales bacterium]|nr:hypothetical protein [Hyphomicrobiales bacterium]